MLASPQRCPRLVKVATWFEATVKNEGPHSRWAVECTVTGLNSSGESVFRGKLHVGNYSGGIELHPGQTATFRYYTFGPHGGFAKAPPSAATFSAHCDPVDYGQWGPPVCLARGTLIATPHGPVRVQDIRLGMTVWSTDRRGRRIRARIVATGRTPVPPTVRIVRLHLVDGRTVWVSPGHPTPDGRPISSLRPGDRLDGVRVISVRRVRYRGMLTYDVLPAGPTSTYFANGVLLGSTLADVPGLVKVADSHPDQQR
ncbi:MAG: Hint domain-containing protein [Actinomycetota bacterium]